MSLLHAFLLGILEGLTELLPVSSTGHLILLANVLGHDSEASKVFDVVIQLGAVVAVAVYFRARLGKLIKGLLRRDPASRQLTLALLVAFIPTAIVGLSVHRWVKAHLFGPIPVAGALAVGGVLMIVVDRFRPNRRDEPAPTEGEADELSTITLRAALVIGLCQCFALWPGSSRSMVTIVGGMMCGLRLRAAAEFSFLLAIPTLGAATVYDMYKNGSLILSMDGGVAALAVGLVTSFVVTWGVVAWFLRYVSRVGLAPFGVYRIALAVAVLLLV